MVARRDSGTVTAELVLTLPAVLMVIGLAFGLMSFQLQRMELVSAASTIARAIARDEPIEFVDLLVSELGSKVLFEIQEENGLICVALRKTVDVFGIDLPNFDFVETQCAKAQGQ